MEFKKAFNYVLKHKTEIFLPIICILQFLACFFYDFWIVATVFSILLLAISDFADIICYFLFFQLFSSCGNFTLISNIAATSLICIKYIIDLIRKKRKFYTAPFIVTVLICILYSAFAYQITSDGFFQGIILIGALFLVYLAFVYRDKLNLQRAADFLILGIIASVLVASLATCFKTKNFDIFDGFGIAKRLKLLTGNENWLSIYCSLALSYYVSSLINGKGNIYKNIIFSLIIVSIGLLTHSKCFLITCTFIILYFFVMLILKFKKKSLTFILPAILLLGIVCFAFKTTISSTFERFWVKTQASTFWASITTERSTIWTEYINEITSSIPKMLFGVGFFNERLVDIGPHNLYIHLVYRMGLFGIILLSILGYCYYQSSNKSKQLSYKTCLPLLVFLMICMVETFI